MKLASTNSGIERMVSLAATAGTVPLPEDGNAADAGAAGAIDGVGADVEGSSDCADGLAETGVGDLTGGGEAGGAGGVGAGAGGAVAVAGWVVADAGGAVAGPATSGEALKVTSTTSGSPCRNTSSWSADVKPVRENRSRYRPSLIDRSRTAPSRSVVNSPLAAPSRRTRTRASGRPSPSRTRTMTIVEAEATDDARRACVAPPACPCPCANTAASTRNEQATSAGAKPNQKECTAALVIVGIVGISAGISALGRSGMVAHRARRRPTNARINI
jgi:hypothetical protein